MCAAGEGFRSACGPERLLIEGLAALGGRFGRRRGLFRGRKGSVGLGFRMNGRGPPFGVGVRPLDKPEGEGSFIAHDQSSCSQV